MQLLASMNNSEQWQSVLSNCQLDQWAKTDNKNDNLQNLEKTVPFCVTSALTLTELTDLLANPEVNIILSLDSPEYAIGLLLQQAISTSEALDIWQEQTLSILDLQHKHRRQLQLIQTEGLLINPNNAPEWLAKSITPIDSSSFLLARSNIYHLFADQALRQDTEAERCRQRLIACSLPLLDQSLMIFNIDELHQEYVVDKDQQLLASNEENGLMQEQLFHVQEELERQLQKNQQLLDQNQKNEQSFAAQKQQLNELQTELERSEQEQVKSQQELTASNEENDLVLQQLFYVQEELEQRLLSNQELAKQHSKLELDHRNNTAAFLAKYQKSEQAVATAKQQSREAQEQLLACTEENEQLRKQLSELKQVHQQSLQNLTELEKQLHASKQEEVLTKHKLASAQIDLTAVKGSRLWKSVSPVRKLVSAFKSSKAREQLQHNAALITGSEYFDLAWYLHRYPDVVESGVNPAEHYLIFGADEGRSPGPLFDGNWYLSQYPDVAENNTNPLLHYILFGAQEGRAISPRLLQHLADPSEANSVDEKSSNQDTKAAD